jgi:hypothetical protein
MATWPYRVRMGINESLAERKMFPETKISGPGLCPDRKIN